MPVDSTAIVAVVTQLLPEVIAFIKGFHTASGQLPTDQQVIDNMNIDAKRVIAISDNWLANHPASQ